MIPIDKNSEEFKQFNKAINDCINEVFDMLVDYNASIQGTFGITDRAFLSTTYIMTTACMERMWDLQENENISQKDREEMAQAFGTELRLLIKKFTSVDTIELTQKVLLTNQNINNGTVN